MTSMLPLRVLVLVWDEARAHLPRFEESKVWVCGISDAWRVAG